MTYAPSDAERAFYAAVAAAFAEHADVSARFGLCDLDRLAGLFEYDGRQKFGLRRDEDGKVTAIPDERSKLAADVEKIAPTFPASVQDPFAGPINPITGEPENACITVIPDFSGDVPGWTCVMYLTA